MDTFRWLCTMAGLLVLTLGVTVGSKELNFCEIGTNEEQCCLIENKCPPGYDVIEKHANDVNCQAPSTTLTTTPTTTPLITTTSNSTPLITPTATPLTSTPPTTTPPTTTLTTTTPTTTTQTSQSTSATTSPNSSGTSDASDDQKTTTDDTNPTTATTGAMVNICVKKSDDAFPVVIVASAAGAGGFVLVVVVVVVVSVCLCRRNSKTRKNKETKHTRMSNIISERDAVHIEVPDVNEESPKEREKTQYVNIQYTTDLAEGIEQAHDKVTRYTRDPTFKPQPDEKSPDYENKAMGTWSQLHKEEKEIEELPTAPVPPSPTSGNHYVPMVPNTAEWSPEEVYVNTGEPVEDEEQELYENRETVMQELGISNEGSTVDDDSCELEDYENTQQFRRDPVQIVNHGVSETNQDSRTEERADKGESIYANYSVFKQ